MASIGGRLRELSEAFSTSGIEAPEAEARWLLAEVLNLSGTELTLRAASELPPDAENRLRSWSERRCRREPLQYIIGIAPFRQLDLEVTPAVLIPRPETELLVDWILRRAPENGTLLDVGTGSGAIALAAAEERPDLRVTGADLSLAALAIAERNRNKYRLDRVELRHSDLLSAFVGERFDLIAANLPYVTEAEYPTLPPEVRDYEPFEALVAAADGLDLIFKLSDQLLNHLNPDGAAIFELSPAQAVPVARHLEKIGFTGAIHRDYTGRDRFVTAELKS